EAGPAPPRPAAAHDPRFALRVPRRGVRVGNEDRREPGSRELEHRAAGPRDGEVRRGEGVGEGLYVRTQVVMRRRARRAEAFLEVGEVALAAGVEDVE